VNLFISVAVSPQSVRQAAGVVKITVDVHEQASGVPSSLEALGAEIDVTVLTSGD
jgi:ERCC4-type nuclease